MTTLIVADVEHNDAGNTNSSSRKMQQAQQKGIEIMSESDLLSMLRNLD